MSIQAMSSPSKRLARSPQNLTKNRKIAKDVPLRGHLLFSSVSNLEFKI
jgi:hypothetical protein